MKWALVVVSLTFAGCTSELDDDGLPTMSGSEYNHTPVSEPGGSAQGRLQGILQAHNEVRTGVEADRSISELRWSDELAEVAQTWADHLKDKDCALEHSKGSFGENLAWFAGQQVTAEHVVQAWASEGRCYTYGRFMNSDKCSSECDSSGGCGHYTQLLWRNTSLLGCGMATCEGELDQEIWVCNYDPPGNFIGEYPY